MMQGTVVACQSFRREDSVERMSREHRRRRTVTRAVAALLLAAAVLAAPPSPAAPSGRPASPDTLVPAARLPVRWEVHPGVDSLAVRHCRRALVAGRDRLLAMCWPYVRPPRAVTVHLVTTDTFRRWTARLLPDWGIGVALGDRTVIIDAWRSDRRERPLGEVLLHELAHALLEQAAGGVPLPRWFHEGVAQEVAGEWRWRDTVGLLLEGVPDLDDLERDFHGPLPAADRAYRAALLAVRLLEREHGPAVTRRILLATRQTGDFGAGLTRATGWTPEQLAAAFRRTTRWRYGWLVMLTRWPGLFVLMAVVLVVGWIGRRWRDRRRLQEMEREEAAAARPPSHLWPASGPPDDEPPTRH